MSEFKDSLHVVVISNNFYFFTLKSQKYYKQKLHNGPVSAENKTTDI